MEKSIVAILTLQPDKKAEAVEFLKFLVNESRAEQGNIQYDLTESIDSPNTLVIIERWKSDTAISFHGNTPHFQTFLAKKDTFLADAVIHVLTPLT